MNIRDVELRTGLERANVRYYEKEGLLEPERLSNGYRNYSEADVETLLRIKLLRELDVSLAEIRRLQADEVELQEVITQRLEDIKAEKAALAREQKVCETIRADGVEYGQLQAQRYLHQLEALKQTEWERDGKSSSASLYNWRWDVLPEDIRPWERYFARIIDVLINTVIVWIIYYGICGMPPKLNNSDQLICSVLEFLLLLVLEPTQLSLFGTTMGKSIFGIQIRTEDGTKLTWNQALQRVFYLLWYGFGLYIPIFQLYRMYRSYQMYSCGECLPWDRESVYTFRDRKSWRKAAAAVVAVGVMLAGVLVIRQAQLPPNRGQITVAEFADNYNYYTEYLYGGAEYMLDENGQWEPASSSAANSVYVYIDGGRGSRAARFPEYHYTETDGYLTGISFEIYREGDNEQWISTGKPNMLSATLAFAVAQRKAQSLSNVEAEIDQHCMESYSFVVGDLTVSWQVELSGYTYQKESGALVPTSNHAGRPYYYHLIFQITPTTQTQSQPN
ncbi:MAG: MerR family transcriptional regulator [Lachnospiraceae bacterium]|nr:MerR family transcriptional regulator [Lachnospiraceae bacterium]